MIKKQNSLYSEPIIQILLENYKICISEKIGSFNVGERVDLKVIKGRIYLVDCLDDEGYKFAKNESKSVSFRSKRFMIEMNEHFNFLKINGTSYLFEVNEKTNEIAFLRARNN